MPLKTTSSPQKDNENPTVPLPSQNLAEDSHKEKGQGKKLMEQVSDALRTKHREASPCGTTPTALNKPTLTGSNAT